MLKNLDYVGTPNFYNIWVNGLHGMEILCDQTQTPLEFSDHITAKEYANKNSIVEYIIYSTPICISNHDFSGDIYEIVYGYMGENGSLKSELSNSESWIYDLDNLADNLDTVSEENLPAYTMAGLIAHRNLYDIMCAWLHLSGFWAKHRTRKQFFMLQNHEAFGNFLKFLFIKDGGSVFHRAFWVNNRSAW